MLEWYWPCITPNGKGGPHNSRATSCARLHPNLGEQDGAVAVSLVLSRLVPRSQSKLLAGWRWGEWVQVCNPCMVKTIRIAAYSVMYIPTLLLLHLV